jgi:hypothetical protein
MGRRQTETVLERLMRRSNIPTNKDGTNSKTKCWTWTGPTNNAGYGLMKVSKALNMVSVHRIMMIEYHKTINYGDKLEVLHECGNKLCVNPHHLSCGTIKERGLLQKKYKAYNKMFHDPKIMWPVCEYCGNSDYLPHFKRKHSVCQHYLKHKYIRASITGS